MINLVLDMINGRSILEPRPGNPGDYVINDDQGNRLGVVKPRPGNPGDFIVEDNNGNRLGVVGNRYEL